MGKLSIEIFSDRVNSLAGIAVEEFETAGDTVTKLWLTDLRKYPKQPNRMRSGRLNTYVRGVGHYPAEFFNGPKLNAGKAIREGKGKVERTSQKLGAKWSRQTTAQAGGVIATLSNPVTYADEVQGDRQATYHKRTGWLTIGEEFDKTLPAVNAIVDEAIERIIARLLE